jgi:hypothetical protein
MPSHQSGLFVLAARVLISGLLLAAPSLVFAGEKSGSGLLFPLLVWFVIYSSPVWGTILVVLLGIRLLLRKTAQFDSPSVSADFPVTEPSSPPAPFSDAEAKLMLRWGITPEGGRFRHGDLGYDELPDAIQAAKAGGDKQ